MSLGYRWEAFDLHADPRVAWIPPDLPPATTDPRLGTLPLVPADASHLAGPTPFAERPVHNGLMDAVLGTRMLQVTDFELPFGGAVFRHVRTNSDIWDQSWRSDDTGSSMVELLTPERAFWDWNGRRWMMGESPLFLMDASPTWNVGEPPKCYFIPDAFLAIPFVLDTSACANGEGTPPVRRAPLVRCDDRVYRRGLAVPIRRFGPLG